MFKLFTPRNLGPVPAVAATAFVALAIFAWTERTVLVDPEGMSVPYWPWKLWQIGPLLMGFAGAWWLWLSTRRVPWVRSLGLSVLALAVNVGPESWPTIRQEVEAIAQRHGFSLEARLLRLLFLKLRI